VRRPPRAALCRRYWFDIQNSDLSPSVEDTTAVTEFAWKRFVRAFKAEMDEDAAEGVRSAGGALAWP